MRGGGGRHGDGDEDGDEDGGWERGRRRERKRGRERERWERMGRKLDKLTGTHGITRLAANPGRCRFSVLHFGLIWIVKTPIEQSRTKRNRPTYRNKYVSKSKKITKGVTTPMTTTSTTKRADRLRSNRGRVNPTNGRLFLVDFRFINRV